MCTDHGGQTLVNWVRCRNRRRFGYSFYNSQIIITADQNRNLTVCFLAILCLVAIE